ncbi:tRNA uridine-5-carboxymethylaminomethyl(34) synthesis GTPase MnmE [Flavobacterium sp.]|uniref:tRNA uridine-5-carboxymethylaminomethyl(34) synthesis GTPase MnmE n=1 Tax=Flavobacterium sp. TaxID=239 RepID=UPI00261ADA56|nr:tRNA uridine-5-carboxymethylaminomethyl(34) synthesis GTPase MnmE [Flavobacterium sp.]
MSANLKDTIVALATAPGVGAIAVVRISGEQALTIAAQLFRSIKGKDLRKQASHTILLGHIIEDEQVIDEVLLSLFKGPHSYTGENVVEISCHGSSYIQQRILSLAVKHGCRMAEPGEFTLRAFLNGKLDLSQAEAVADLIASDSAAAHQLAMNQMRGGFSSEIAKLREELLNFASLIELELDFAEEDVAFADRKAFEALVQRILFVLKRLIDSFAVGNVLKNGVPVAIIGEPNVGKSTLLNALLNEERALVSDIAGTTRDTVEDEISIGGIRFRFIDTAGIRVTTDVVEQMGIQKTFEKAGAAKVVLYLLSLEETSDVTAVFTEIAQQKNRFPDKFLVVVLNKIDRLSENFITNFSNRFQETFSEISGLQFVGISARERSGVETLKNLLQAQVALGTIRSDETVVSNVRHFDALQQALDAMLRVDSGIKSNISSDLLAIDIKDALYYFGLITGQVTNDELLGNIFANFCIGK